MAVYPTRIWTKFESEIYVDDEGRFIRPEDMDEKEFRQFVLWVLGLAVPQKNIEMVRESIESRKIVSKYSCPKCRHGITLIQEGWIHSNPVQCDCECNLIISEMAKLR